ncbi:DNA-3-methyladenine glycosylase family protein [Niallia sp. 03133]|uniref:DNA-3-methyladenine glycosylase family protein n=1 Tax=Niallia sp. 03133 TaxID=3458060 RepID=UPI004044385B
MDRSRAAAQIKGGCLYKLVEVSGEPILLKIQNALSSIYVEFPIGSPSEKYRGLIANYIGEWFDFDQDLENFYKVASKDRVLNNLAEKYKGLRVICIPDSFEPLTWAIIGQQINLKFAYTLKKRFIEHFGESLIYEEERYWLYPAYKIIATLDVEDLRKLQFTSKKAEYIIGVAKAMKNGEYTRELLLQKCDYDQIKQVLLNIKGIGAWSADYVLMKCFHYPQAFPIADVGLHHAIKLQLDLKSKPTLEEIKELSLKWEGWQAYATF